MSLFLSVNLVCPHCDAAVSMDAVGSVNADRRPDYRDAILDNNFQDTTCDSCGKNFRLQPEFNYLDAENGLWIASLPSSGVPNYLATEDEVTALFDKSYGKSAPKAAQSVGEGLDVRITFGWPALREKLFARLEGLDDVVLEMVKLELLRRLPEAPLAPGIELRLVEIVEDTMVMIWQNTADETALQEIRVSRALYDEVAAKAKAWAPIRAQIDDGPFVDMQKLYLGKGRAA